jgi:Uma2 family endonuclease
MALAKEIALENSFAMQAVQNALALNVEEYLAGELHSRDRHEYLGGTVYAMAGASIGHNLIAGNLFSSLRTHLRGKPCQVFMSDVKLRLRISEEDVFYYPDVMAACDPSDAERYFKRRPQVLIEVLSPETESIDRREKFLSYIQIETLAEYILVGQNKMEATVFRRANKWEPEILNRADESLRIESLNFALPLNSVYEGVKI